MQLSYRGIKYETSTAAPAIQVTETEELGHYRGATYHICRVANMVASKTNYILKFRGALVN